jgi:hypothetical protein
MGHDGRFAMEALDAKYSFPPNQLLPSAPPMRAQYGLESGRQLMSKFNGSGLPDHTYGRVNAPVLPPIRVPEASVHAGQAYHPTQAASRSHVQVQPPPKEEKVAGGVAAHLDYEMEQMVDFVAEMAQGMYDLLKSRLCLADIDMVRSVLPNGPMSPAFRKYVAQILSSTRLPSSTILLGLHYLATRMTMLSSSGIYGSGSARLYHMLTTALMLGSKFLDDNTFQNRSWAEVSNISVAELNSRELDWLVDINWDLHFEPADPQGFSAWLQEWKIWQAKRVESAMESLKLTPLDANIRRQGSLKARPPLTPVYTPPYHESFFGQGPKDRTPPHWQMWPPTHRSMMDRSPPSAPHTGPNTPDWYGRRGAVGYNAPAPSYLQHPVGPPPQVLPSSHSPYYHPYHQHYSPVSWSGHATGCLCPYGSRHDRHSMGQAYAPQMVVG